MLRYFLRLLALGAALALAWVGSTAASEEIWWPILCGIAIALLVALWPSRRGQQESSLGHNVRLLGAFLLTIVLLLALQLLHLQVLQGEEISRRRVELPDPEGDIVNVRPLIADRRTHRGRIYDRDGVLLANIVIGAQDYVRRTYSRGDLGHILGFHNPVYGNAGLEATYDDYLAGRVGDDPFGLFLEELLHRPHYGTDLHLTLDIGLQEAAQQAYEQVIQEVLGKECPQGQCPNGAVVLLDPRTGAILAMVAYPYYDPRPLVFNPEAPDWEAEQARITAYWDGLRTSSAALLVNRATSGLYPPGSTFKVLTAAAALETGLVTPDTYVSCPETYTVTGHVIVNAAENLAGRMEKQNVLEDFQWSCNTAFAQIGLMLGTERYNDYAKRFGLYYGTTAPGQWPDFTDLPASPSTIANNRTFLERETALADTAYGQGELQVTPLYMAMLAATVANDGTTMRPYLVERAENPDGQVLYQAELSPLRVPIGSRTAHTVRDLMVAVVKDGYGFRAQIEGVTVAGKTGTAEPASGDPHAWFIAFAPAETPRFAVAVVVEHAGHGSQVAAPIARMVLEAALQQP